MAEAGVNVPLLLRTVQTLRERFAVLRDLGPVAAVMEEWPRDPDQTAAPHSASPEDRLPFEVEGPPLRRTLGSVVDRDGRMDRVRYVWFGSDWPAISRITRLCRDANGFVPFVRRKYGLPENCGTTNAVARWIWTVFELAETSPPFTVLTLGGFSKEVFRWHDSGCGITESAIKAAGEGNPLLQIAGLFTGHGTFHPPRYWQLDDLVEASITVMDLIEVAIPSLAEEGGKGDPDADEGPEDTTRKGGRRRKRTAEGLNVDQWVAAMAAGDPSFRHLSEKQAQAYGDHLFAARTIGTCEIWTQMKAQLEAEKREAAERAEAELADRLGEDEDGNGLRLSSTKHGTGKQRATRKDLEHEREVAAFLRSKGEQPRKKQSE